MTTLAAWTLGSMLWSMIVFFFWFMAIWVFVALFADVVRRRDISGWAKAGWLFVMFIIPFLGCLFYIAARPRTLEQDAGFMSPRSARATESPADEIERLGRLRESGKITVDEYESLKQRAIA
jgi:hypothetical protein